MGLLSAGSPLDWPASEPYRNRIKEDGIEQFLHGYHAAKNFRNHGLKWGDEVEYTLIQMDHTARKATLLLNATDLLHKLQQAENDNPSAVPTLWRPEYPRWMIEGTPGVPYRCYAADLVNVERNMILRRTELTNLLEPSQALLTITAFPRIGCAHYTTPKTLPFGPVARSFFTSDSVINEHARFPTLSRNIRIRGGAKVDIRMPMFRDVHTLVTQPLIPRDPTHLAMLQHVVAELPAQHPDAQAVRDALEAQVHGEIAMDSSAFGMGCACLQVTIQGRDMAESRLLYDQLAVMAPIMLALTAATPALRGLLADTDVRWDVISMSMDDRTEQEKTSGAFPKARYSSIDCYLSCRGRHNPALYNDLPIPINDAAYARLINGGVDHLLAQHIAHLFIRDPLAIYKESVEQDNTQSTDHFENIQSTNWNTVRFKLPPPDSDIGWRTEFRSMEIGLTDFENAAFSVFMVLLSRVILAFKLDFYMPMSKVDSNMETAHKRDAVNAEKFYFRKNVFKVSDGSSFLCECGHIHNASLVGGHAECEDINKFCRKTLENEASNDADGDCSPLEKMSIDEIFNGKPLCRNGMQQGFQFAGLIPLVRGYLNAVGIDEATRARLFIYLDFISQRASGQLCTTAAYIRHLVRGHASYAHDSVISEPICYDVMHTLQEVTKGRVDAPELLGEFASMMFTDENETADTMMQKMQKIREGAEAGLLRGSTMPQSALMDTIRSIARKRNDAKCGC